MLVMMVPRSAVVAMVPFGHREILGDRKRQAVAVLGMDVYRLVDVGMVRLCPRRRTRSDPPIRVASAAEDQHPAAPHPELAAVSDQRDEHEDAEGDQGHPDDPLHHRVGAFRKPLAEDDGKHPDHEDDERVAERVERAEHQRRATVLL